MKENIIHVLTIRFQVYIFLIVSISAGVFSLFLRDDLFKNYKILYSFTLGSLFLILLIVITISNYLETEKFISINKK